jgi:hypothetical protein
MNIIAIRFAFQPQSVGSGRNQSALSLLIFDYPIHLILLSKKAFPVVIRLLPTADSRLLTDIDAF